MPALAVRQVDASAGRPRIRKPSLVCGGGAKGVNVADVGVGLVGVRLIDRPGSDVAATKGVLRRAHKEIRRGHVILVAERPGRTFARYSFSSVGPVK